MPIAREDGFLQTHDLAPVSCLGIESPRLQECIARVQRDRVRGVFGSPGFGFTGTDLDFLAQLPWIEAAWFWDVDVMSVDGLYALDDLRFFGLHPQRPAIDFGRFPKLQRAVIEPKAKDRGLDTLPALELLHVWRFQPKERDFTSLALPASLTELQILWANATSLDALPALPDLRRLEVHRCRNLESLGNLASKFPKLEHLVVSACGKVTQQEAIRVAHDLAAGSHVSIQGTVHSTGGGHGHSRA